VSDGGPGATLFPHEGSRRAATLVPPGADLAGLAEAAAGCQACDLWRSGTQTVFGEGGDTARVMLVGEQPGDREDREGRPFVGPAGRLLDEALERAGIDRRSIYVTNAVKHFKWTAKGKRRIHQRPDAAEIAACRPWLDAELAVVKPDVVVCLGATAAQALLGKDFRVSRQRGQVVEWPGGMLVTATIHPSAVLRAGDDEARQAQMDSLVGDLAVVARLLAERAEGRRTA
jgi:DNA polymerase